MSICRRLLLNQFIFTVTSSLNHWHSHFTRNPPLSALKKSLILLNNENKSLFQLKLESRKPVSIISRRIKQLRSQLSGKFECLSGKMKNALPLFNVGVIFMSFLQLNLFVSVTRFRGGKCDCILSVELNVVAIKRQVEKYFNEEINKKLS